MRSCTQESAFVDLAELVRRRAGIELSAHGFRSIADRLQPVAQIFGFKDSTRLLAELRNPHEELARAVTEAITTRDTWFFRDEVVFSFFETAILPELMRARAETKRLRVWSAGSSTGQEAYSLAMILDEVLPVGRDWTVDLFATDLSSSAVARSVDGIYSQYEIERGLSAERRERHFALEGDSRRASERLRRRIVNRVFNLLDHFGWLGELDVIFCRNVLIYLAPEERTVVLDKFHRTLARDGYLVLGATESSLPASFKPAAGPRGVFVRA